MQDYKFKNKERTEVAKILKTDISEIKTVMIDFKSVARIRRKPTQTLRIKLQETL